MEYTYPSYSSWLKKVAAIDNSSVCKLLPTQRCPLEKPHSNRWKFLCNKQNEQETGKEGTDATSADKNKMSTWKVEATSAWGVNANNASEFPSFVLHAVKVFEDFLQNTEPTVKITDLMTTTQITSIIKEKGIIVDLEQSWLWLVVRCNRKDELMLFVTGKNISQKTMMELKYVFEEGPGKRCNVTSLYCKSLNKIDDTLVRHTTFLVGSEVLNETVCGLEVQLAPKTNFWSNAAGGETVAKTVERLLRPFPKLTVLEIGCGIGIISLMLASKVNQIIGVDCQSEIEEAEITCEINNIKNAKFLGGKPSDLIARIKNAVPKSKTYAIINANTATGRSIEIMTCLRQLDYIRRIIMITTLTKQSVRAILELTRPMERDLGFAFMPVAAAVVDTLPLGPHYETVILMDRLPTHKFATPKFKKVMNQMPKKAPKGKVPSTKIFRKFSKFSWKKEKTPPEDNSTMDLNIESMGTKLGKRVHPLEVVSHIPPKKIASRFDNIFAEPGKKLNKVEKKPQIRINLLYKKKAHERKEADLRERLSNNRVNPDIIQKVKEHQAILEVANEKLNGPESNVDIKTAKELQSMLNMVLDQANKLQNQIPKSVWNRISPPKKSDECLPNEEDNMLKGRFVQETTSRDILITTENDFTEDLIDEDQPKLKKYGNLAPLDPDNVAPMCRAASPDFTIPASKTTGKKTRAKLRRIRNKDKKRGSVPCVQMAIKGDEWLVPNKSSPPNKKISPTRRISPILNKDGQRYFSPPHKQSPPFRVQMSPPRRQFIAPNMSIRNQVSPPRRQISPELMLIDNPRPVMRPCPERSQQDIELISPSKHGPSRWMPNSYDINRPYISPPRRQASPDVEIISPVRHEIGKSRPLIRQERRISPLHRPTSPLRRPFSPRRQMSPPRRQISPRRQMSPRRLMSPPRRQISPRRQMSPRRQISPPRRQISPRRQVSPRRQMSPPRRQMSPPRRQMSPPRRQMSSPRRQISPRREISPRRQMSPPRRQISPQRQLSPNRYSDAWDIPNRGAIEKEHWRPGNHPEKLWYEDRSGPLNLPSTSHDRFDSEEKWDLKNVSSWTNKQELVKYPIKSIRDQNQAQDNRWQSSLQPSGNLSNWNSRGGGTRSQETWRKDVNRWEGQDDWHDLPEDAKDPWGDDGSNEKDVIPQEPWQKFDNKTPIRRNEVEQSGWQGPSQGLNPLESVPSLNRNQWLSSNTSNDNRWKSNEMIQKIPPLNWQAPGNPAWQKNIGIPAQRPPFNMNIFKN
ncbi:uncharacterized protein [Prorops nasuta]